MNFKELLGTKRFQKIVLTSLFIVFLLGIGSLILFYVYKTPFIGHGDGANTAIVARNLAEGKGYTVDHVLYFITYYPGISHPEDLWPIGLPTLISIFFKIFGVSTFIAKLPNVLLFLIFIATIFWILQRRYNPFIAFFTTIFILVNINLFRVVREPYNDIGFLIFLNLSFVFMALWSLEQNKKYLIWTGVFVGLTILFKQTGVLLLPFLVFIIILRMMKKNEENLSKSIFKKTLLFLLIALLVASPWLIRNTLLFGDPIYSQVRIITPISEVPGTLQDEYFRVLFNETDVKSLNEATIYEKIKFNLKAWNNFSRLLRSDEIVPGVLLFLFLFALVVLPFNEFEKSLVKVNILFILMYILFIIYYAHVEARYFLFVIPFISFISAKLLDFIYRQIIKLELKVLYAIILCFLLFYVTTPILFSVYYYSKQLSEDPVFQQLKIVEENTPPNAVIMTRLAPAITWHTNRKTVMVPFGEISDFYTIINMYNVTHVLITDPLWYYATHLNVRPWVYDIDNFVGNMANQSLVNETICTSKIIGTGCLYSIDSNIVNKESELKLLEKEGYDCLEQLQQIFKQKNINSEEEIICYS